MFTLPLIFVSLILGAVHSMPPDKNVRSFHIIKPRSIDINNAYGLAMESRLEKTVEPTHYNLTLEPYLEDGYFTGTVRINVTWLQDTQAITIHCGPQLKILEKEVVVLERGEKKIIGVRSVDMDYKKPIATLELEKTVPKSSKGYLQFSFRGEFQTDRTEAFFKATYSVEENEKIVAGTQLRPNNARLMFPCFDEPGYKARFDLSVVRPRNMVALSNMEVARTEDIEGEPDAVRDIFERSPPMPTYTLGLVIADLKLIDNFTKHPSIDGKSHIYLRVWARPEFMEALDDINERVELVYRKMEGYWKVPLPLKKLDIVALPGYTGIKPADNWGLIVFKESDLAYKGYYVLAQEIAYQWLGGLTTPAWWSDAHLNKALVGYMALEIASQINQASVMEGRVQYLYSMYYEFSKRYPFSRITGMKQENTCSKLELLFRMFHYTIGGPTFENAIKGFLESRKFKTFKSDDIWSALSAAAVESKTMPASVDAKTVAKSWVDKYRLPLVTITRNYEDNSLVATQKVYLRERPHDVPDADQMTWWVPIVIIRQDKLDFTKTTPEVWTNEKELKIKNMPAKDQFVIVNPEEIAPFPVNYDAQNWEMISNYLQSDKRTNIPELTRAKLHHDAWNLAYAGELSFATAMNMTNFLKKERSVLVWDSMFVMIDHIGRQICPCIKEKFRKFVRLFLIPLYEEMTKEEREGEEDCKTSLCKRTRSVLCSNEHKPCIRHAQEQFAKWMQAKNPDEGNPVATSYFCPVFRYGTQKEWDFALQRVISFPPSRQQSERTYLLKTLAGCPIASSRINKILNITLIEGNGNFTETDLFLIFSMLTGDYEGYSVLLEFLDQNFQFLKEKYGSNHNLWDNLISSATSQFKTTEGLETVSKFYTSHSGQFGSAEHIIVKNMKRIKEEAAWSEVNIPVLSKWLDGYIAESTVKDSQYIN